MYSRSYSISSIQILLNYLIIFFFHAYRSFLLHVFLLIEGLARPITQETRHDVVNSQWFFRSYSSLMMTVRALFLARIVDTYVNLVGEFMAGNIMILINSMLREF